MKKVKEAEKELYDMKLSKMKKNTIVPQSVLSKVRFKCAFVGRMVLM